MTVIHIHTTPADHQIAKLTALAIGLHMVESAFPSPLPGVKPGIANIVTLYVLQRYGFKTAAWVNVLRVLVSSMLLGQFLTPSFMLSLTGALVSLVALGLAHKLLSKRYFSVISLSILAAFAHIAGQLLVVRLALIPHASVLYLVPIFALAALVFGLVNGLVTAKLLETPASRHLIQNA
ncbi:MAG TPA: Gx transporter family protein [Methylophilus sp.]